MNNKLEVKELVILKNRQDIDNYRIYEIIAINQDKVDVVVVAEKEVRNKIGYKFKDMPIDLFKTFI